jgi:8-oxo-dGTP diphosphatase
METEILEKYGNRLRVRVCGLCWRDNKLLVANHKLNSEGVFWAPIGGGVEFGELVHDALIREFREEANIKIFPGKFLFGCELLKNPLHAIELFFEADFEKGVVSLGNDPESLPDKQILKEIKFMEFNELMDLKADKRHGIFQRVKNADDLKKLNGFYRI